MKLCFVVIVFGLSFIICNKHYIKYSACYKLPIPKTPFYPDAYKFANTKEEFLSNMKLINNAIKVEAIIDTNKLDFNNHTYLFVFGAPIKKMYYSFKTTLFDDKSPSYAKAIRHKKKCVFINYNIPTGYTYLYEIKKDETLTGFNGIYEIHWIDKDSLNDTRRKNSYNIKVVIIAAKNLDCDIPTVTLPVQTN